MRNALTGPRHRQFFFIHLMKTAGTTFRVQAAQNFDPSEIFPWQLGVGDFERIVQYVGVHQFLDLAPETRDRVRFFSAHIPFVVAELTAPEAVKISVVREPIERTLSYLRHCQRDHVEHRGKTLEEIYEDPWYFSRFIENHQTKMFSMSAEEALQGPEDSMVRRLNPDDKTPAELREDPVFVDAVRRELSSGSGRALMSFADRAPTEIVHVDERRLSTALANLGRVDVLAVTEHLDDLSSVMTQDYGWAVGLPSALNTTEARPSSASFRRRIAADNEADMTLYEQARRMRTRPARPSERREDRVLERTASRRTS